MIDEILKTIYDDNSEHVIKRYDEFIDETIQRFRHEVRLENVKNKILKIVKEKYPQYTYRWRYLGDGGESLHVYNVDKENEDALEDYMYDIMDAERNGEFDILCCHPHDKENTEKYYPEMLVKGE